jgi:tRNA threonylcarbamoyladenosine biosynthesis protein TsaB
MPTRLLALETSGLYGSLALAEDGQVVADRTLSPPQRTAQSLAPAIEQLVAEVGWSIRDLSVVAVTVGPGSFTGLRVGVVTAKTLAYALGAQVVGVNTLEVIAARISNQPQLVTVLDAQRQELFVARWRWSESGEWLARRAHALGLDLRLAVAAKSKRHGLGPRLDQDRESPSRDT